MSIISKCSVEEERHVQLVGVCTLHQGVVLIGKSEGLLLHHRHIHVGANHLSQSHLLQVGNLERKQQQFLIEKDRNKQFNPKRPKNNTVEAPNVITDNVINRLL